MYVAYYSPEGFNLLDGDHEYPQSGGRTPRAAAKLTLALMNNPGYSVSLEIPNEGRTHFSCAEPQPEVFAAYLRRERGIVIHSPEPVQSL